MICKLSTHIRSLAKEDEGLATIEFILAIPLFLIMLLILFDLGSYRAALSQSTIAARNAAWAKAEGGICLHWSTLPKLIDDRTIIFPSTCQVQPVSSASSEFWSGLDSAGGEQLAGTVSGVSAAGFVKSKIYMHFTPHEWPAMTFTPYSNEFTMLERSAWMHKEAALKVGYDKEMKQRFQQGTGQLMSLFPNVFPGAR